MPLFVRLTLYRETAEHDVAIILSVHVSQHFIVQSPHFVSVRKRNGKLRVQAAVHYENVATINSSFSEISPTA